MQVATDKVCVYEAVTVVLEGPSNERYDDFESEIWSRGGSNPHRVQHIHSFVGHS